MKIHFNPSSFLRNILFLSGCYIFILLLPFFLFSQNNSGLLLLEDFEDGELSSEISLNITGSFNDLPGIKDITNFNSSKAFGFGLSTCSANCFDNYVTDLIISFPDQTYISQFSFKEIELYGGWGSKGHILIDGVQIDSTFGGDKGNAGIADSTYELHTIPLYKEVNSIILRVRDITNASEIFVDDILIYETSDREGLIAFYPFNGNANDESGNGNNGSVNGASLYPFGEVHLV